MGVYTSKVSRKCDQKVRRSIGMKHNEVNAKNSNDIHQMLASMIIVKKTKVQKTKMGDSVRTSKYKHIFRKAFN